MSKKRRVLVLVGFGILVAASLVQVFYRILQDGPLLDMSSADSIPVWADCHTVYANDQSDTVASCVRDERLHLTLSLKALRTMSRRAVVFKEGRYETGRYRTYHNEGVSNGVGYTSALAPNEALSKLYLAVDSIIAQDSLTGTCIFIGQYITISDDDSKLLTELRLPRRSTVRVTLDSSLSGMLLKIIAAP